MAHIDPIRAEPRRRFFDRAVWQLPWGKGPRNTPAHTELSQTGEREVDASAGAEGATAIMPPPAGVPEAPYALDAHRAADERPPGTSAPGGPDMSLVYAAQHPISEIYVGTFGPGEHADGRVLPHDYTNDEAPGPLGHLPTYELVYDDYTKDPLVGVRYANTFIGDDQLAFIEAMQRGEIGGAPGGTAPQLGRQQEIPWYSQAQPPPGFIPLSTQQGSRRVVSLPDNSPSTLAALGADEMAMLAGDM